MLVNRATSRESGRLAVARWAPAWSLLLAVSCVVAKEDAGVSGDQAPAPVRLEIRDKIPEDLRYQKPDLPDAKNALTHWKASKADYVNLLDVRTYLDYLSHFRSSGAFPDGELGKELENWVASNKKSFDLLEQGNRQEACRFPEPMSQDELFPGLSHLRQLTRMRWIRCGLLLKEGKQEEAVNEVLAALRTGRLLLDGRGALIPYLVGCAIHSMGLGFGIELAGHKDLTRESLKRILDDLPAGAVGPSQMLATVRAEFHVGFTRRLECMRLERPIVEQMVAFISMTDTKVADPRSVAALEPLLREAKNPFDWKATFELAARHYGGMIASVQKPWPDRDRKLEAEIEKLYENWNSLLTRFVRLSLTEHLSTSTRKAPDSVENIGGETDVATDKIAELLDNILPAPPDDDLPQLKRDFSKEENAWGLSWAGMTELAMVRSLSSMYRQQQEVQSSRAILALRIYEIDHGALPGRLKDLVDAGLLASEPEDVFCQGKLKYSKERRVVWSVGQDEIDGGGEYTDADPWASKDAVWKIPKAQ